MSARPPLLSRRILEWAGPRLGAPELADDAADIFAAKSRQGGSVEARRWYRRQAAATLPLLLSAGASRVARLGQARVSVIDFRLGVRMLVKHPGLTVMSVTAMAFAVAVGAVTFESARDIMFPRLPVPDGDRVVRLYDRDALTGDRAGLRPAELVHLRDNARALAMIGAWRPVERNLWLGEGAVVPVRGGELTASAFEVAGLPPALGRPLLPSDEAAGAAPVVVLSHQLWQAHFNGAPLVIGRTVRLNDVPTTVVGVLAPSHVFPEPVEFYLPFPLDVLATAGTGPAVMGFGMLAPGATITEAATELEAMRESLIAASPVDREHRTLVLAPFAEPAVTTSGVLTNVAFAITALFLLMLMVVVCANVALLLFARAASREGEMAVRGALGASRGRIVGQLFVEALVLAGVATLVGLLAGAAALRFGVGLANAAPGNALPFWVEDTFSTGTVLWAILLGLAGAVVAGIAPALQVTGRSPGTRLHQHAGRSSGLHMGGLWSGIVVTQVALTVILLPVVLAMGNFYWKVRSAEPGVAAAQFLSTRVDVDAPAGEASLQQFMQRLETEPWLQGATLSDVVWPAFRRAWPLHVEGDTPDAQPAHSQHLAVSAGFFDVMGARMVAGRGLQAADAGHNRVMVDETFVREVLGGRNAVGRQVRIGGIHATEDPDATQPLFEIVGVVSDLGLNPFADLPTRAVMYHPLTTTGAQSLALNVRVTGDPATFAQRLRVLALQHEHLRVHDVRTLDRRMAQPAAEYGAWFGIMLAAGALALLLTLAGIYAVMSFTVARRTREIGLRVALGAAPRQVAQSIFGRSVRQVAYGVAAGGITIPAFLLLMTRVINPAPSFPPLLTGAVLLGYLAAVMGICLLACVAPLRRALRVQPTEAMSANA